MWLYSKHLKPSLRLGNCKVPRPTPVFGRSVGQVYLRVISLKLALQIFFGMSTQVRDYLTSWWTAFLAGRPVSFMTCNSARPPSCLLKCIFFYLALSLISFQLVTSIDFKGGNSNHHFTLCDKCKIVVESFKEVSVTDSLRNLFSDPVFASRV